MTGGSVTIRRARVEGWPDEVQIDVRDGIVVGIGESVTGDRLDAGAYDARGALVTAGFVDSHIHLDKAYILDRCAIQEGTLAEAVALTSRAKSAFTVEDVRERAERGIRAAMLHGTTTLRTFVETDSKAGLRSLDALLSLRQEYAWAIDIEICAFAQEGTSDDAETRAIMRLALEAGAGVVGGCPYTDSSPEDHVRFIFDLAAEFDVDVDFHVDFDLDPTGSVIPFVVAETERRGFAGRVVVGHATKLSAMAPAVARELAESLSQHGVGLVVLPATDLFLMGRGSEHLIPRGMAPASLATVPGLRMAVASNNLHNPFTPFGDASLLRMANLFATIGQLARDDELARAFDLVGPTAARTIGRRGDLAVGEPADLVVIEADSAADAVRSIAPVIASFKRGVQVLDRPRAQILSRSEPPSHEENP